MSNILVLRSFCACKDSPQRQLQQEYSTERQTCPAQHPMSNGGILTDNDNFFLGFAFSV